MRLNWKQTNGIGMSKEAHTFLSLFSGCGGFDYGFEECGYKSLGAFDIDSDAVAVHSVNLKGDCHVADLQTASVTRANFGQPNVVISGSPCQGFSSLGKRQHSDPRNSLLWRGAEIATGLRPEVIVLENVSGVLTATLKHHFERAISVLNSSGYMTQTLQVTCSDFGVPQIRKRVFLFGYLKRLERKLALVPAPGTTLENCLRDVVNCGSHEPVVLKKGSNEFRIAKRIRQHQKLCNVRGGDRAVATWEIPEVFGNTTSTEQRVLVAIRRLRRQNRIRANGDADPVTLAILRRECGSRAESVLTRLVEKGYVRSIGKRFDLAQTFNGKYRRLSNSHHSPAVDTRFGTPRYFLHPEENRGFSVREAARIQGFPDDFVFAGSLATQFRLVGNAVPPPVAMAVAKAIKESLL